MGVSIGKLVDHEIGGGWGQDVPTGEEYEPAVVIRGTDFRRVALGEWSNIPRRFHRPSALASRLLKPNDIVFEVSGGSRDQPVGRALLVTEAILDNLGDRAICASFCKLIRIDNSSADPSYIYRLLQAAYRDGRLSAYCVQSTGITNFKWKPFLEDFEIELPSRALQERVSEILRSLDDLVQNNWRRIALLEQMARAIYREWFVHFRYPGYEDEFIGSALGQIPLGWSVRPLSGLAASERYAITSGPFGSKLGRKDYRPDGVPVIRGANLKIGGGFDTTDVAFVSPAKADALKSSLARPNDIVVTQRGTLGQVGLIPPSSRWPRYVLSQSQMKITVDQASTTPEFIYSQLRDESTTARFVAQAMTSGVPHVNLALLREFEVLAPPVEIVREFSLTIGALEELRFALSANTIVLEAQRDLLLPRLVAGSTDISQLDSPLEPRVA